MQLPLRGGGRGGQPGPARPWSVRSRSRSPGRAASPPPRRCPARAASAPSQTVRRRRRAATATAGGRLQVAMRGGRVGETFSAGLRSSARSTLMFRPPIVTVPLSAKAAAASADVPNVAWPGVRHRGGGFKRQQRAAGTKPNCLVERGSENIRERQCCAVHAPKPRNLPEASVASCSFSISPQLAKASWTCAGNGAGKRVSATVSGQREAAGGPGLRGTHEGTRREASGAGERGGQ